MKKIRRWIALVFAALFLVAASISVFADFSDVDITRLTDEEWRKQLEEQASKADLPLLCQISKNTFHPGDVFTLTIGMLSVSSAESIAINSPYLMDSFELLKSEDMLTGTIREGKNARSSITVYTTNTPYTGGGILRLTYRVKENAQAGTRKMSFTGMLTKPYVPTPIRPGSQPMYSSNIQSMGALLEYTIESHSYGTYESVDAEQHSRVCKDCGYTEYEPHTFGEWQMDVPATADQDGVQKRSCTVCVFEESKVIPRLPAETTEEPETPPVETTPQETALVETTADSDTLETTVEGPEMTTYETEKEMNCRGSDGWIAVGVAAAIVVGVIAVIVIVYLIRKKRKA